MLNRNINLQFKNYYFNLASFCIMLHHWKLSLLAQNIVLTSSVSVETHPPIAASVNQILPPILSWVDVVYDTKKIL